MNGLDCRPVEALAFNYLSFAFSTALNNMIWPCLAALLTAAASVSFWKKITATKSSQPPPDHDHRRIVNNEPTIPPSITTPATTTTTTAVNLALEEADDHSTSSNELGRNRRRSGKFTVYYSDEHDGGAEGDLTADNGGVGVGGGEEEWCCYWDWERGLKMRAGEDVSLGWYRYQDLTAIDGNVVRLWD